MDSSALEKRSLKSAADGGHGSGHGHQPHQGQGQSHGLDGDDEPSLTGDSPAHDFDVTRADRFAASFRPSWAPLLPSEGEPAKTGRIRRADASHRPPAGAGAYPLQTADAASTETPLRIAGRRGRGRSVLVAALSAVGFCGAAYWGIRSSTPTADGSVVAKQARQRDSHAYQASDNVESAVSSARTMPAGPGSGPEAAAMTDPPFPTAAQDSEAVIAPALAQAQPELDLPAVNENANEPLAAAAPPAAAEPPGAEVHLDEPPAPEAHRDAIAAAQPARLERADHTEIAAPAPPPPRAAEAATPAVPTPAPRPSVAVAAKPAATPKLVVTPAARPAPAPPESRAAEAAPAAIEKPTATPAPTVMAISAPALRDGTAAAPATAAPAPAISEKHAAAAIAAAPTLAPSIATDTAPASDSAGPVQAQGPLLSVRALPEDSKVWLDGQRVDNPFEVRLPHGSKHRIEARSDGYEMSSQTVRLESDASLTITLRRSTPPAVLRVQKQPESHPRGAGFVTTNPY